jgi:hypothetical protein
MKNLFFIFYLLVCFLEQTNGQRVLPIDTNKYRIDLPEYWKPGNRVWKILTDKLPLVCNEIKDKELCGDHCNPLYTVEFEMSEPVIYEYLSNHISSIYTNNQYVRPSEIWEIQTLYGFESSLLLRNEKGVLITRFILVDTNEVWRVSNRVTLATYAPPPVPSATVRRRAPRNGYVDGEPIVQVINPQTSQEGETPFSYINRNREKLVPRYRDMIDIVDRKINSW